MAPLFEALRVLNKAAHDAARAAAKGNASEYAELRKLAGITDDLVDGFKHQTEAA